MIKAECDRCGAQETAPGSVVSILGPMGKPRLPEQWKRVQIPSDDERIQSEIKELCPVCVNALRAFFEGDGAVAGLLEPETLAQLQAENQLSQATIKPLDVGGAPSGPTFKTLQDTMEMLAGCNCPQPQEPRPPCPVHEQGEDERPNLTERARKLAAGIGPCTCAGVGFGTEDCVAHHPNGLKAGTHLECHLTGTAGITGKCPGIYRRGLFREHMERWHGVKVAERSKPCPYCAEIASGIMELGPHIAKEHPGDWQAWIDGGQKAG